MVIHGQQTLYNSQLPHLLDLWTIQIGPISRARLALQRQPHDPVRSGIRIGIDQRSIDYAEYRRSRSNAERQRGHRRQRESGILNDLPQAKTEILKHRLHSSLLAVRWIRP